MLRIVWNVFQWGRAIRPPKYKCESGKYPSQYSHEKIHIVEKGKSRAICGFVPFYQWQPLGQPDGITPICQRCVNFAARHDWITEEPAKPAKKQKRGKHAKI